MTQQQYIEKVNDTASEIFIWVGMIAFVAVALGFIFIISSLNS